jgi:hypothetical protein
MKALPLDTEVKNLNQEDVERDKRIGKLVSEAIGSAIVLGISLYLLYREWKGSSA